MHAPTAIQTMHNEEAYLIIYCLNCIRCMQNSTFETGLKIGKVEGRLIIAEQYRQRGALWDIIVNGLKRNPQLSSYHTLVTNSVRRRVRDYVHREVSQ